MHLGSKTPYRPAGDPETYQTPPEGARPRHLTLISRHGSRNLNKPRAYVTLRELVRRAALHSAARGTLFEKLESELARVEATQPTALGTLTRHGHEEQRSFGGRMAKRFPTLLGSERSLVFFAADHVRTLESAEAFRMGLRDAIEPTSTTRPAPITFVPPGSSEAHQAHLEQYAWRAGWWKQWSSPRGVGLIRSALHRLFDDRFVEGLICDDLAFAAQSVSDLYTLYQLDACIEPAAARNHFFALFPTPEAPAFVEARKDAVKWHDIGGHCGPGGRLSAELAIPLLQSMLVTSRAASEDRTPSSVARFVHSDALMSLLLLLDLLPRDPKAFKAANVIPMMANFQWLTYTSPQGQCWVRMLLNERELILPKPGNTRVYLPLEEVERYCMAAIKPVAAPAATA